MSKLFDTLEKIRENEGAVPAARRPEDKPGSAVPAKPRPRLIVFLAVAIIASGAYALFSRVPTPDPGAVRRQQAVIPPAALPVAKTLSSPSQRPATAGADAFSRCNALGAEYVDKDQHWRGIYFLQKASAMAPGRMEPLINLAVAYAELGLYRKANDYFAEAVKIDPAYGPLLANLRIFSRAGLLDEKILSGLAPGGLGDSALPAAPPPGKGK